jgi:hypothetical protein
MPLVSLFLCGSCWMIVPWCVTVCPCLLYGENRHGKYVCCQQALQVASSTGETWVCIQAGCCRCGNDTVSVLSMKRCSAAAAAAAGVI